MKACKLRLLNDVAVEKCVVSPGGSSQVANGGARPVAVVAARRR